MTDRSKIVFERFCPSTVAVSNSAAVSYFLLPQVAATRHYATLDTTYVTTLTLWVFTTAMYYYYYRHPPLTTHPTKTNTDPALASTIPFRSGGDSSFTCRLVRHLSGIVGAIILFRATRERRDIDSMFGNIPNYDPSSGDGLPPNDGNNNQRVPPSADRIDQTLDDANRAAL